MDNTKRIIVGMAVGLAAIVLYLQVLHFVDVKTGYYKQQEEALSPTTQPASGANTRPASPPTATTSGPSISAAPTASAGSSIHVVPATQPAAQSAHVSIGSAAANDPNYAVQLNLEPTGAGIDSVVLNSFRVQARGNDRYRFETADPQRLDMLPLGTRTVTLNDATVDLSSVRWTLVSRTPTRAVYGADVSDGNKTLLEIRKSFEIYPRSNANEGYEVQIDYTFTNPTHQEMKVRTAFNGPTVPPQETTHDRQLVGGFRASKDSIDLQTHQLEELKPDKYNGQINLTSYKGQAARWAGAESNYFGAVVLPHALNGAEGDPDYIDNILAQGVNIDKDTPVEDRQSYFIFQTKDFKIAPASSVRMPLSLFLGPKWRNVLDTPHYTAYPRIYNLLLVIRGGTCGFCTFAWMVDGIVLLLKGMHFIFRDWGLAIIGLVAIVRIVLHPITRQSQISMARMSKMGPEMERLKKKYGEDKEALNKAMIEFHREQGLGPYLGCLPMFLQMPIWIALYGVLQTTFELRQAPFLWNLTWIHDLSQPDFLVRFSHPIPFLFGYELHGLNLLPVLLAFVMFVQARMTQPPSLTPDQAKQQRMMQWMSPIMFLLIFYGYPSGLNLYVFASTGIGIIESKIVRDHIKAREEAEKAGRVFVETKPTRASKQGKPVTKEEPKRRGPAAWLSGQWARLLDQAEQVRQEQDRRGKKKA